MFNDFLHGVAVDHDYESVSSSLVLGFVDAEVIIPIYECMRAVVRVALKPDFDRFEITSKILVCGISFVD
jgi:hypothetical protein